jgi:hypothetical protein
VEKKGNPKHLPVNLADFRKEVQVGQLIGQGHPCDRPALDVDVAADVGAFAACNIAVKASKAV